MTEQSTKNSPVSKKRSHDEAEGLLTSGALVEKSEDTHLPTPTSPSALRSSPGTGRQPSPTISIESSALSEARPMTLSAIQAIPPSSTSLVNTKKRKLAFAEKQEERARQKLQKEAKEKQREVETQRKEQERHSRDEDRRRKEEEKEAAKRKQELDKAQKQKARDEEKQVKDKAKREKEEKKKARTLEKEDAKGKKEEEKNRKERAQLRLASFFQKPTAGKASRDSSRSPSRRSSVVSQVGIGDIADEAPTKASPQKRQGAKPAFLPFFVPKNVRMAPLNGFSQDQNLANMAVTRLDQGMQQEEFRGSEAAMARFKSQKKKRRQGPPCTLKEIVEKIQGTSTSPIDLTGEATLPQLSDVSYKILSFAEDVRPPYVGTYTRSVSPKSALKLSRCPFTRQLPSTNYDYDSEAEWEPPNEDDEDLESGDDESDLGEEGDEEMDGFLDDEDDPGRKKHIVGEMTPISSGLCWTNGPDEEGPLEEHRMQTLSHDHSFPIDPYSTAYWPKSHQQPKQHQQPASMQPPRLPLSNLNPNKSPSSTSPSLKGEDPAQNSAEMFRQFPSNAPTDAQSTAGAVPNGGKPLKLAPEDVIPAFKHAVKGSDLTKAGLVETLKKQ